MFLGVPQVSFRPSTVAILTAKSGVAALADCRAGRLIWYSWTCICQRWRGWNVCAATKAAPALKATEISWSHLQAIPLKSQIQSSPEGFGVKFIGLTGEAKGSSGTFIENQSSSRQLNFPATAVVTDPTLKRSQFAEAPTPYAIMRNFF